MGARINPQARFDRLEQEGQQKIKAQQQGQRDAINRRFAALGLQGSGAAIKAEQQLGRDTAAQQSQLRGQVNTLREEDTMRRQELDDARKFAREERLGSQDFGASQAALARDFASGESRLQRDFASGEAQKQRDYGTSERLSTQEFAAEQRALDEKFKLKLDDRAGMRFNKQLRQADKQFKKQLELDRYVTEINRGFAEAEANRPGMIGGILQDLGVSGGNTQKIQQGLNVLNPIGGASLGSMW